MLVNGSHLTYCTNIHPAESWEEVRANLERFVVEVKARVSPDAPFGVGLRLSARAASELVGSRSRARLASPLGVLRRWLDERGLYVFTINGFPYGPFHGTPVKEQVYRPDWLEAERVEYTKRLADILIELLPDGVTGTISTVPGCFQARAPWNPGDAGDAGRAMASNLARCAEYLAQLERDTGKHLILALEPEPCCVMETLGQAVEFFERHALDRRYLGVCLDACHAAVEFEQLGVALAQLRAANITIAKVQLGCGLRIAPVDAAAREALEPFAEGVYLHQVVARSGSELVRYVDLPEALADARAADEWRVHFHVPIFREHFGTLGSTQGDLAALLAEHRRMPISTHLEVETYTWDVLPAEFRAEPIVDAVARELAWVIERL
ncbi:MAG: metabolite traffic protein EboE [Deltaproteobacteria bacterium]|nr:metabolite traffic protein EboE [Deltaproteobacteria bacterium]